MKSRRRRLMLSVALLGSAAVHAADPAAVLRVVAPVNQSMPMLRMVGSVPAEGLLKDVGEALAERLGLSAAFVPLPGKRAGPAVASGAADLLCYVKPGWLDDKVLWTRPFLYGTGIIAAHPAAPAVTSLYELRNESLGTVLGYHYPILDLAFMQSIRREDVPDATTNLRRLALGRIRYAVTDRAALDYFLRDNPTSGLREVIEVERYQLSCALSPDKAQLLEPLNRVIDRMQADGSLEVLFNRYR
ncbi:substrate-binding periplasmic protein [Roseateles sp. BYS78W]|uniref:Substrate-binding periplasmic protein n=1 Tax=Pelomonas candidula TaxID=3299025 RepID=A0ABW7HF08_9BURK